MEDKLSEVEGSLRPGFRFHPTDEELLNLYLKPKIQGQHGEHDIIPEIDACKLDPEQWPTMFPRKFNRKELFFFCRLKKCKHSNGKPSYDRKTSGGFWKVNGADRLIMSEDTNAKIGTRKKLDFYRGSWDNKESSNWVCHEYRLNPNDEDETSETYVVCRIKNKKEKKLKTALAQPETSAEELMEFMNSLPPILGPDETGPDYNNILTCNASSFVPDFQYGDLPSPSIYPANYSNFGTSPDHDNLENRYSPGWVSGTMPENFSAPTRDNGQS